MLVSARRACQTFFFDCSLPLYRRKNIHSSIVMSGGCTFEGSNIMMDFDRFHYCPRWKSFRFLHFRNLMEISANNRIWDDIFHRYETEKPLFDFKIECGKRFVSSLRSRVRCWFFTTNEISRSNRGFVQNCTFCS